MLNKRINRLIFLLSLLGLGISVFLSYEYNQSGPVPCPIAGGGCEQVRQSPYATFLGFYIPYYGILFYFTIAGICVWLIHKYSKMLYFFRLLTAITGFLFGVYLTYVEGAIIHAYCFWCVSSFVISIVILLLLLYNIKASNTDIT